MNIEPDDFARAFMYGAELVARGQLSAAALADAAERTEGVTASFARELIRRCVLAAVMADRAIEDADLSRELDGLLSDAERLTRSVLGGRPSERLPAEDDTDDEH